MTAQGLRNISIEKIRYSDLNDLERIFTGAFGEAVDVAIIRQRIRRIRQFYFVLLPLSSISLWLKNIINIYICRVNGRVAGFMQVSYFNRGQVHLDYVAINKKYRGQGLGTLILRKLIDRSVRKNYDIILEVKSDNPAYNLYSRLGFIAQAQIIHYGKNIDNNTDLLMRHSRLLSGLRARQDRDWRQIYQLYLKSLPLRLHNIARHGVEEFNPSLFTKTMEWFKNYMMGNIRKQYVIEKKGRIIGSLELLSYLKAHSHTVNVMLDPEYEYMRESVYKQALRLLQDYKRGTIGTTFYSDGAEKERALERLGFTKTESYYLMFRPAYLQANKINAIGKKTDYSHLHKVLEQKMPRAGYAAIK